jgi:shikimate kinase
MMMSAGDKRNIILCGFMATGKSSVGRRLAEIVHYDFLDLDIAIEAEAGMSIPEIFSSRGEPEFRALESRMVDRIAEKTGCVIAAGGGTIVDPQNLDRLQRRGVIVTLTADIPTILQRVGKGDDRPMLGEGDRQEKIRVLLQKREHAYSKADIIVDTSSLSIDEVARYLLIRLRDFGISP